MHIDEKITSTQLLFLTNAYRRKSCVNESLPQILFLTNAYRRKRCVDESVVGATFDTIAITIAILLIQLLFLTNAYRRKRRGDEVRLVRHFGPN